MQHNYIMHKYLFLFKHISAGSRFTTPHNSTEGMPNWFTPIGLALLAYLGLRVYLALRKKK
jgi:hypothetical protein